MNATTTIASRAVLIALLALLASATSLMAQEQRIAVPFDEPGYAPGSQLDDMATSNDIDLFTPPISVEPPNSHAAYWMENALVHPVLRPPVILTRPTARYSMWWDSIETVLGLRSSNQR